MSDQKIQVFPEAPKAQSTNYFEKCNEEFEQALKTGEVLQKADIIDEIAKRNEVDWMDKVIDAIKAPGAALEWLGKNLMMAFAGTWLAEITGITAKLEEARKKVMEAVQNPMKTVKDAFDSIADFDILKTFGINSASFGWVETGIGQRVSAAGSLGQTVYGLGRVGRYFELNPDAAKQIPEDEAEKEAWWKETMLKSGVTNEQDKVLDILMGRKTVGAFFPQATTAKQPEKPADSTEVTEKEGRIEHPKYGVLKPRNEVLAKYKDKLENWFAQLKDYVIKNQTTIAVGVAASGVAGVISQIIAPSFKFSFDSLKTIAQLPFSSKWSFLASSGLTLSAYLLYDNAFAIHYNGQAYLPENEDKLGEFLKDKVKEEKEKRPELAKVTDEAIDDVVRVINEPEKEFEKVIPTLNQAMFSIVDGVAEGFALSDVETIRIGNEKGLRELYRQMEIKKGQNPELQEKYTELLRKLGEVIVRVEQGEKLTQEMFDLLNPEAAEVGLGIFAHNGFYTYRLFDPSTGIALADSTFVKIGVDSNLPASEQVEKSYYIGDLTVMERGFNVAWTESRRVFGSWYNYLTMSDSELIDGLEREIKRGTVQIVCDGGWYYATNLATGALKKYVQLPFDLVSNLLKTATFQEANWTEFAVDWGMGLFPVAVLTLTQSVRDPIGAIKAVYNKPGLSALKLAAYPITGGIKVGTMLYKVVSHVRGGGNVSDFLTKPRDQILSYLTSRMHNTKATFHDTLRRGDGVASAVEITGIRKELSDLYMAKSLTYELEYSKESVAATKKTIDELLQRTTLDKQSFATDTPGTMRMKIDAEIVKLNAKLEAISRINILKKAAEKMKTGQHDEASALIKKAGYEAQIKNEGQLEAKISELSGFALGQGRLARLEEAQKYLETGKKSDAERVLRQMKHENPQITLEQLKVEIEQAKAKIKTDIPTELKFLERISELQQLFAWGSGEQRTTTETGALSESEKKTGGAGEAERVMTPEEHAAKLKSDIEILAGLRTQEGIVEQIRTMDQELITKTAEVNKEISDLVEKSGAQIDVETAKKIDDLKIKHDEILAKGMAERLEWTKHLDIDTAKKMQIETGEAYRSRVSKLVKADTPALRGRLSQAAKGTLVSAALAVGISLLFIGASELSKDRAEQVDLTKYKKKTEDSSLMSVPEEEKVSSSMEEATEEETGMQLMAIKQYMISKEQVTYGEMFSILNNFSTLDKADFDHFTSVVQRTAKEHDKALEKIKEMIVKNADKIAAHYKKFPEESAKHFHQGQHFILDINKDKTKIEFKYADGDEYVKKAYQMFDERRKHLSLYQSGQTPGMGTVILDSGERVVPLWGTWLDVQDAWRDGSRGQYGSMWGNIGWAAVGAVSDVALGASIFTLGGSGVLSAALKGARLTGAAAKTVKTVALVGEVAPAVVGLSMATYQQFKSPFNKKLEILL